MQLHYNLTEATFMLKNTVKSLKTPQCQNFAGMFMTLN